MHETGAIGIGPGIGAIAVGVVLLALGAACFKNYRGIADYMHRKDVSAWQSVPGLGRYMSQKIQKRPPRRTGMYLGFILTFFAIVAISLGISSLLFGRR